MYARIILQSYDVGPTKIYVRACLDIKKEKIFTIVARPQALKPIIQWVLMSTEHNSMAYRIV